jgi:hypothetical protein
MLFIYIGLVAAIAIWGSKKEASILAAVWILGLVILFVSGKEGKEAGHFFNALQAIAGLYMAFRIHYMMNSKPSNISSHKSNEPFEFSPLSHEANDPRILSKHPIDGDDPRKDN